MEKAACACGLVFARIDRHCLPMILRCVRTHGRFYLFLRLVLAAMLLAVTLSPMSARIGIGPVPLGLQQAHDAHPCAAMTTCESCSESGRRDGGTCACPMHLACLPNPPSRFFHVSAGLRLRETAALPSGRSPPSPDQPPRAVAA